MIALGALAGLFILTGLAVGGFAFYGSRSAGPTPSGGGSSRLLYAGLALVGVGIGLALPAVLLVGNDRHAAKRAPGGVDLSANQATGRKLFATNCATCHTLRASNSVGKIGPNLDVLQPPAALVTNAIQLGRAQGNGNMPALLLTGDDAKNVASYIAAVAGH